MEENRLAAVIDGGGGNITRFLNDADGQRIAKLGRGGESITIGQFWALKGRRAATKHVFAGATRIASKLLPPPGWDDVPRGTAAVVPTMNDSGCDPSSDQPQKCDVLTGGEPVLNDYYADAKVRPETYYYHPDHLGSTSWVTDQNARVHEHFEYFPYGAVWRDPRSDVGASPQKGSASDADTRGSPVGHRCLARRGDLEMAWGSGVTSLWTAVLRGRFLDGAASRTALGIQCR